MLSSNRQPVYACYQNLHDVDPDTEKFKKMIDNIWIKTDERYAAAHASWSVGEAGGEYGIRAGPGPG
jgi:hypothetical protein